MTIDCQILRMYSNDRSMACVLKLVRNQCVHLIILCLSIHWDKRERERESVRVSSSVKKRISRDSRECHDQENMTRSFTHMFSMILLIKKNKNWKWRRKEV